MKKYLLLLLLLISNGIFSQSKSLDLVSVKLISELNTIAPAQEFYVGIKLKMLDEWHTYWKNPGDAGLATRIKWNLPWAILIAVDSLTNQFRRRDWQKAMLTAADVGHYVSDGHMPLHLARNYDGQINNQTTPFPRNSFCKDCIFSVS